MGVSSFDVIEGEGVGLHNGWCLETMDFVDFLLCCMQSTQNCVAKALVPVLNGPEHFFNIGFGLYLNVCVKINLFEKDKWVNEALLPCFP